MTMIRFRGTRSRMALVASLLVVSSLSSAAIAQDSFGPAPRPRDVRDSRDYRDPRDIRQPIPTPLPSNVPIQGGNISSDISGATAMLESVVRTMYSHIEPGRDNNPNELMAYADLRVLRLYAGALEVSGWTLEQAYQDFLQFRTAGHYRDGYQHISDRKALAAWERYRAYRETVRTMLLRVRTTAVSVEHQVSFCDQQVAREWQVEVLPVLRDTIAAVEPLLIDEYSHQRYTAYGPNGSTTAATTIIPISTNGLPQNACEVTRLATHMPHNGRGHGTGRYFEVKAYGGPIRVRGIRFTNYQKSSGASLPVELSVNEIVEPSRPLFIQCNRGRWVDASDIEISWESGGRGNNQRVYGTLDLVESSPSDPARR